MQTKQGKELEPWTGRAEGVSELKLAEKAVKKPNVLGQRGTSQPNSAEFLTHKTGWRKKAVSRH